MRNEPAFVIEAYKKVGRQEAGENTPELPLNQEKNKQDLLK